MFGMTENHALTIYLMTPNVYVALLIKPPKDQKKSNNFQLQIEDKTYTDTERSI